MTLKKFLHLAGILTKQFFGSKFFRKNSSSVSSREFFMLSERKQTLPKNMKKTKQIEITIHDIPVCQEFEGHFQVHTTYTEVLFKRMNRNTRYNFFLKLVKIFLVLIIFYKMNTDYDTFLKMLISLCQNRFKVEKIFQLHKDGNFGPGL